MKVIRSQREIGDEEAKKGAGVGRGQGQVTHCAGDMPQRDLLPAGDHKRMPSGHDEHLHICTCSPTNLRERETHVLKN